MTCHNCRIEAKKFGKDRKGNQRYRCNQCPKTFQDHQPKPPATPEGERRYSPAEVVSTETVPVLGHPDPERICTSHVERQNLTMRMMIRRLTRLTNAFSKKWENLWAALCLHFAFYNFCRIHRTIRVTPAMEAGITDRAWELQELPS